MPSRHRGGSQGPIELARLKVSDLDPFPPFSQTNEEMAGPEQQQPGLLVWRLDRREPHARPLGRSNNRLGIGRIFLMALDAWLHIGRRRQAHVSARTFGKATRCAISDFAYLINAASAASLGCIRRMIAAINRSLRQCPAQSGSLRTTQ